MEYSFSRVFETKNETKNLILWNEYRYGFFGGI